MKILNKIIIIIFAGIFIYGCNEVLERTNPFDPNISMKTFLEEGYETLEVDNTMKLKDSPYFITKNLLLRAKLMVEPGVEIKFSPGIALIIDGNEPNSEIIANGTSESMITFSSSGNNNWAGIKFEHVQLTTSRFKYCRFENADYALEIMDDTLTVENCHFENTSIFINGFGYAYQGEFNGVMPSRPLIKNSTFSNSMINMTNGTQPWILYNSFSGGSYAVSANEDSKPKIAYNKFGTELEHQGACSFSNAQPQIYNNTFTAFLENAIQFVGGCTSVIENNVFNNGNVGIYVRTTNDPDINQNALNNTLTIMNNNFENISDYNISLKIIGASGEARQTSNLNAAQNYWSTTDTTAIDLKIYDKEDDAQLGKVMYTPFHTSPVANAGAGW